MCKYIKHIKQDVSNILRPMDRFNLIRFKVPARGVLSRHCLSLAPSATSDVCAHLDNPHLSTGVFVSLIRQVICGLFQMSSMLSITNLWPQVTRSLTHSLLSKVCCLSLTLSVSLLFWMLSPSHFVPNQRVVVHLIYIFHFLRLLLGLCEAQHVPSVLTNCLDVFTQWGPVWCLSLSLSPSFPWGTSDQT